MQSLFYTERIELVREDYSRVIRFVENPKFQLSTAKERNKEVIGQHVAKYLHESGQWAVWFHKHSSQFTIAYKDGFSDYGIEAAEEGKERFTGYASLAEWAYKEGIYAKSVCTSEGKVFLQAVGLTDNPDKPFKAIPSTGRKKRQKRLSNGNGAQTQKKMRHDDEALRKTEEIV